MDQNTVQQPLFAPATQDGQNNDDIDMNEVFAEYFINEFEDPLDAYTGGMANFSGAAVAMDAMQVGGKPSLPTGGIKTAFHANVLQQTTPPATVAKKPKVDTSIGVSSSTPQQQIQQQSSGPATTSSVVSQTNAAPIFQTVPSLGGGSVVVGSIPAQQPPATQPQQQQQPDTTPLPSINPSLPAAPQGAAAAPAPPIAASPALTLPVGVGIRLGGIGGIVAATANSNRPPTQQYALWAQQGGGALSEQALAERRQRNREHAKRSRVRKKFMLESLQEQVRALQRENRNLRLLVQEHIPEHGVQIIAECCTSALSKDDGEQGEDGANSKTASLAKVDRTLMGALNAAQQCFVLSDPKLPDNPIIFASPGFYQLTGYTSKEVLGRNCRFLQGQGTDPRAVEVIRKAVATGSDATVCLLNYKADRTPFWNNFFVAALRDSDNNIVNFVGVQTEVAPEKAAVPCLEEKVNAILPLQGTKEDK